MRGRRNLNGHFYLTNSFYTLYLTSLTFYLFQIDTPNGLMDGSFHMACDDPETTQSGSIGTPVDALLWKDNDERNFEAVVAEFSFMAEEVDGDRR